jgi:hypothetical protein
MQNKRRISSSLLGGQFRTKGVPTRFVDSSFFCAGSGRCLLYFNSIIFSIVISNETKDGKHVCKLTHLSSVVYNRILHSRYKHINIVRGGPFQIFLPSPPRAPPPSSPCTAAPIPAVNGCSTIPAYPPPGRDRPIPATLNPAQM